MGSILLEIREMPAVGFAVLCAFPTVIMALLLRVGVKWRHISGLIAGTPLVPIGSAAEGIAAVEGVAEAGLGGPLTASLTGASCVWYRTLVERMETSRSGMSWSKREGDESRKAFLLRDSSGVCEVRAFGDYLTPTDRSVWFGTTKKPRNLQPEKYPGSVPLSEIHAKQSGHEQSFRYTEDRIYPGDHVYVLGQFFKTPLFDEDEVEHHEVGIDEDDDDSDEPKTADSEQRRFHGGSSLDVRRQDELDSEITTAPLRITVPSDTHYPLVVSGVRADGARRLHAIRSKGMFILASIFASILAFLLWAHFLH